MVGNCALCDHPIPRDAVVSQGKVRCPSCGCETRVGDDGAVRIHGAFASGDTMVGPASPTAAAAAAPPSSGSAAGSPTPSIPGYVFLALLGRGGMGTVYQARQLALDRVVAVKLLSDPFASDPDYVLRFEREAKAMASFNHPNITAVFDRGSQDGRPYFAMELVDGRPLRTILHESGGKLPQARAMRILLQVVEALAYVHARGTIHRDIKPENILVTADDLVKVTDFGLAAVMDSKSLGLTRSNVAMGTVHYMAPEQTSDARSADLRADVYSFGVTLYEVLVGALPVGRWLPPHQVDGRLDPRLDKVVLTCLQADREGRYPDMAPVKAALSEILAHPIAAQVLADRDAIDALDLDPDIDEEPAKTKVPGPVPRPAPRAPAGGPAAASPRPPSPAPPPPPSGPPPGPQAAAPTPPRLGGVVLPPPGTPPAPPAAGNPNIASEDIVRILERAREKEARDGPVTLRSPPTRVHGSEPEAPPPSRARGRILATLAVLAGIFLLGRHFEPVLVCSVLGSLKRNELEAQPPGTGRDLQLRLWALARDRGLGIARDRPQSLSSLVASGSPVRARMALTLLSGSPRPEAVEVITRGVAHPDATVAETAIKALQRQGSAEASSALQRIATSGIPGRSELARAALARLESGGS